MPDFARLTVRVESDGFARVESDLRGLDDGFSRAQRGIVTMSQALQALDIVFRVVGAGVAFLTDQFAASVDAAREQENALDALDQTLRSTGQFSDRYAEQLAGLAGEMQKVTTFGDESVTAIQNQLIAFGAAEDQISRLTQAALDLGTGMGKDVSGAAFILGKAIAGEFGTLSRYGIIVEDNATATEKLEQALEQIERRFGGQARAAALTYTGQQQQLANAFGEVREQIGFLVVESDAMLALLSELSRLSFDAADSLATLRGSFDTDPMTGFVLFLYDAIDATLAFTEGGYQVLVFLREWNGGIWDKAIELVSRFVEMIQQAAAWLYERFGPAIDFALQGIKAFGGFLADSFLNNPLFGPAVPVVTFFSDLAQQSFAAAADAGNSLGSIRSEFERSRAVLEEKIRIRIEVENTENIETAISQSEARLTRLRQELSSFQGFKIRDPEVVGEQSVENLAAFTGAQSEAADTTERLSEAIVAEEYRLRLLERQLQSTTRGTGIKAGGDDEAAKAAEKAADAAAKHEQQLREQALTLSRALDPATDYIAALQELETLKPYLSQQIYNKALDEARTAYLNATTQLDEMTEAAKRVREELKGPVDLLADELRLIRDLGANGLLDADETARAITKAKDDFRSLREDAVDQLGQIEQAVQGIGRATADAFVDAASTGKFEFRSLLEAIRDDVVRLFATELIVDPLVEGLTDAIRKAKTAGTTEAEIRSAEDRVASEAPNIIDRSVPDFQAAVRSTQDGFTTAARNVEAAWIDAAQRVAATAQDGPGSSIRPEPSERPSVDVPTPPAGPEAPPVAETDRPLVTEEAIASPFETAAAGVEAAWVGVTNTVQGLFTQMIGTVGSLFSSILVGLFGGGGGAPSWEGFGLAVLGGAISGLVGGLGGALSGWLGGSAPFEGTGSGPATSVDGPATVDPGVGFASTSAAIDGAAVRIETASASLGQTSAAFSMSADRFHEDVMAFGRASERQARDAATGAGFGRRSREAPDDFLPTTPAATRRTSTGRAVTDDQPAGDTIIVNVPTTIPVTSLDPRQAASVIREQMPLIKREIIKGIERGGDLAIAVKRRKGGLG